MRLLLVQTPVNVWQGDKPERIIPANDVVLTLYYEKRTPRAAFVRVTGERTRQNYNFAALTVT
jgi:hypothetical protein